MDLALHVSSFNWTGGAERLAPTLIATARLADQAGFATLTLMDHWFQMEGHNDPVEDMLDGYTTLGFLAGQTERLQLGLLVTGVTYRHPGLLAKTLATLDVLSGGRAMLGIGAAWYEREHLGLGVPFPPTAERFERLEETLQICRQMWSGEVGTYEGRHYQLAETMCHPLPVQRPGPRVLIGGGGEKKTLRFVAKYADACNLFGDVDTVRHKLEVLRGHCEAEGRDYETVEKTILPMGDPLGDADGYVESLRGYADLGVTKAWVSPPPTTSDPVAYVELLAAEVLPRVAEV